MSASRGNGPQSLAIRGSPPSASLLRYYNETRTHLSLDKDAPLSRTLKRAGRILPPSPRRTASPVWPDLICDRHRTGRNRQTVQTALLPPIATCPAHGLTNLSTKPSIGCGGSGVFLSLGSFGLRKKLPSSISLNPAASTSCRRSASSMRCKVPDSEIPVPADPNDQL